MRPDELKRLLVRQARAAEAEFRAIERRFEDPLGRAADEAERHAKASLEAAEALENAVEGVEAPPGVRRAFFLISRALGRFAASGRALAMEAARYGVPEDPELAGLAHAVRRSAEELAEAVERLGEADAVAAGQPRAIGAFRAAGRAEHLRRGATKGLGDEPDAVLAIKLRGLHRRFSEVSSHAAEAAELLAEVLGG